jgi:hypothetical protein
VPSLGPVGRQLRQTLTDVGVLEVNPDGLRFTRDYLFNSASQAARVVPRKLANGRTAWKGEDGRTLKAIQEGDVANGNGNA